MKTLNLRLVVLMTKDGKHYVAHADSESASEQMFKLLTNGDDPIWKFDPAMETAHFVTVDVMVPDFEPEYDPHDPNSQ